MSEAMKPEVVSVGADKLIIEEMAVIKADEVSLSTSNLDADDDGGKRLTVITEDGLTVLSYFANNGFYPYRVIDSTLKLEKLLPYMDETRDEVLLIVHGMTKFTMTQVCTFVRDHTTADSVSFTKIPIVVMSDIDLPDLVMDYATYREDLFYSKLTIEKAESASRMKVDYSEFEPVIKKRGKNKKEEPVINPLMRYFMAYNNDATTEPIVDIDEETYVPLDNVEYSRELRITSKIVQLDLDKLLQKGEIKAN